MSGSKKIGKMVLLTLVAAFMALWTPALTVWALPVSPGQVSGGGDLVAVAGNKVAITRAQLELALARYKQKSGKESLTKSEVSGILEDLIRRGLLLQTRAVEAYKKDPAVIAKLKDYEDTLIVARWAEDQIRSRVQVSQQEARSYYEKNRRQFRTPPRVKASYILLRTRDEAEMVQKKLKQGQDFAQLAKQYSIDLPTGQRGGLIGTISESKKPSSLGKVLFLLAKDQVSDIIATRAGYALFKADELYAPGFKPYDEVANEIRDQLFRKKARDSFKQIVENLEKNSGIKIYGDRLAKIEQNELKTQTTSEKQQETARVVSNK
ncbi:MAG: peptidylprolyl isomerase [Syntrophobacteraceae bacterium]